MSLKQIFEKYKSLDIFDKRCIDDEYVEVVFLNNQIDQWSQISQEIFGPAIKPSGAKPDKNALNLTQAYGGIHDTQTLFKKEVDGKTTLAMFWPWRDRVHTTLKMFVLPDKTT